MTPKVVALTVVTNDGEIFSERIDNFDIRLNHAELIRHFQLKPSDIYDTGWIFSDGTESWRYIDM